jgi:hypothetical protein
VSADDSAGGRAPERADFVTARVAGSRRRPPIAILAWVVVLGGVVAVGLSGRSGGGEGSPGAAEPAAAATHAAEPTARIASSFRVVEGTRSPRFDPDFPTLPPRNASETSAPGPIALEATRQASSVFVHGDVFADQVTWVFVSLQTLDGQVGGWASVSIPGAAGAGTDHRPALRFDVELAVPTVMASGVLLVQANAYNAKRGLIASTRLRLAAAM